MDFRVTKPTHFFALILLVFSFFFIIVLPILSYFFLPIPESYRDIQTIPESFKLLVEIFVLLFQLIFVIGIFVVVPFLWYFLVNRLSLKEMLARLKLRFAEIDVAVLWGVITAIGVIMISIATGIILQSLGVDLTEVSNVPDLEQIFSLPVIFILVAFQPVGEEIFFRGFLLEKINSLYGKKIAIVITALLFGIAHLSYGKLYPVLMAVILGGLFAVLVVKTKNLYSAITAHILINVITVTFYIMAKSFGL